MTKFSKFSIKFFYNTASSRRSSRRQKRKQPTPSSTSLETGQTSTTSENSYDEESLPCSSTTTSVHPIGHNRGSTPSRTSSKTSEKSLKIKPEHKINEQAMDDHETTTNAQPSSSAETINNRYSDIVSNETVPYEMETLEAALRSSLEGNDKGLKPEAIDTTYKALQDYSIALRTTCLQTTNRIRELCELKDKLTSKVDMNEITVVQVMQTLKDSMAGTSKSATKRPYYQNHISSQPKNLTDAHQPKSEAEPTPPEKPANKKLSKTPKRLADGSKKLSSTKSETKSTKNKKSSKQTKGVKTSTKTPPKSMPPLVKSTSPSSPAKPAKFTSPQKNTGSPTKNKINTQPTPPPRTHPAPCGPSASPSPQPQYHYPPPPPRHPPPYPYGHHDYNNYAHHPHQVHPSNFEHHYQNQRPHPHQSPPPSSPHHHQHQQQFHPHPHYPPPQQQQQHHFMRQQANPPYHPGGRFSSPQQRPPFNYNPAPMPRPQQPPLPPPQKQQASSPSSSMVKTETKQPNNENSSSIKQPIESTKHIMQPNRFQNQTRPLHLKVKPLNYMGPTINWNEHFQNPDEVNSNVKSILFGCCDDTDHEKSQKGKDDPKKQKKVCACYCHNVQEVIIKERPVPMSAFPPPNRVPPPQMSGLHGHHPHPPRLSSTPPAVSGGGQHMGGSGSTIGQMTPTSSSSKSKQARGISRMQIVRWTNEETKELRRLLGPLEGLGKVFMFSGLH